MLIVLSIGEDNKCPRDMNLHVIPDHKSGPNRNFMFKLGTINKESKISTDNGTCSMWMKYYVELENSRVDYQDRKHKMKWLNIIASNFENSIKNIYKVQRHMQEGTTTAAD